MPQNIFAYTDSSGVSYPGYVSINRTADGQVEVAVRAAPTEYDGVFVCGHSKDPEAPGRCRPGDENCNNYCGFAPGKGKMADRPNPCQHTKEGAQATFVVPAEAWQKFLSGAD